MIRHVLVAVCDGCAAELTAGVARPTVALSSAFNAGWPQLLSGRLLRAACTDRTADAYLTALGRGENPTTWRAAARREDQPGDGILADTAAGLALPGHQQENREDAMVEPLAGLVLRAQRPRMTGEQR